MVENVKSARSILTSKAMLAYWKRRKAAKAAKADRSARMENALKRIPMLTSDKTIRRIAANALKET